MYICFRNLVAVVSGQRVCARVCVCVGRGGEGAKDLHSEFTPLLKFKN